MGLGSMQIEFIGLVREKERSGADRWRVRVEGNPRKRITLTIGPDHPNFTEHYHAARAGIKLEAPEEIAPPEAHAKKSVGWLRASYLEYLKGLVTAGTRSIKTYNKKKRLLDRLDPHLEYEAQIPKAKLQEFHDGMISTPSQAHAFIEAIRVMYEWAMELEYIEENTALAVKTAYKKGSGAAPWTGDEVKQFMRHFPIGTKQHAAMALLLFTGCRIEDLTILGRQHECTIKGVHSLRWMPSKARSSEVAVPLVDPLKAALRAPKVQGATYILGRKGKPFASGDSMSATFKKWCQEAGLGHLSAHGVRKALAELLAESECTQYEIMAVLGHSEAKTTEVYTRNAERFRLASNAMKRADVSRAWI